MRRLRTQSWPSKTYRLNTRRISAKSPTRRTRTAAEAGRGGGSSGTNGNPAGNLLVSALVSLLTEGLRLAGLGRPQQPAQTMAAAPAAEDAIQPQLPAGDVAGVLEALREDFRHQYFVTGQVNDALYSEDCFFGDPTVSFRGREQYKRNLGLLVPFFWDASIQLKSLQRLPCPAPCGGTQLRADWRLSCWLRLPWVPHVDINGSTTYVLNTDDNQIISHVEEWEVSALQALLLLLRPSERAPWRRQPVSTPDS